MLLKLAFKNVVSRKSSLVIILFITFAVCLFCVANAVFDSTEQGVQTNYVASFTGDFIIRPKSKFQQSLFGDETPVTGELTMLDTIVPYEKINAYLLQMPEVEGTTGQISGAAMAERADGGNRHAIPCRWYPYLRNLQHGQDMRLSAFLQDHVPPFPRMKGRILCSLHSKLLFLQVS